MYNYALATEQKFDFKNNLLLKSFVGYPKKWKCFTKNNFHMKISNGEFFPNYVYGRLSSSSWPDPFWGALIISNRYYKRPEGSGLVYAQVYKTTSTLSTNDTHRDLYYLLGECMHVK